MKQAYVNGELISPEAVQFEMDRLMKFYLEHGVKAEEIKPNLEKLLERAREQAIGAKLLLMRAERLDMPVPDSELDAEIEKIVKQMGGRANFSRALALQKMSEDEVSKLLDAVRGRNGPEVAAWIDEMRKAEPR